MNVSRLEAPRRAMLRIVPEISGEGEQKTQGTKVLMPNGDSLPGVTRLEIVAAVDDVWRAKIWCNVQPPTIDALSVVQAGAPLSWWRRALLFLAGVREVQTTELDETRSHTHTFKRLTFLRLLP